MASWPNNVVRSVKKFYNGHPFQLSKESRSERHLEPRNKLFVKDHAVEPVKKSDIINNYSKNQISAPTEPEPNACEDKITQTIAPETKSQEPVKKTDPKPQSLPVKGKEEAKVTETPCEESLDEEYCAQCKRSEDTDENYTDVIFEQCIVKNRKQINDSEWEYELECIPVDDNKTGVEAEKIAETPYVQSFETYYRPVDKDSCKQEKRSENAYGHDADINVKQCIFKNIKQPDNSEWEYSIWCAHHCESGEFEKTWHCITGKKNSAKKLIPEDVLDGSNTDQTHKSHSDRISLRNNEALKNINQKESSSEDTLECDCSIE